MCDALQWNAEFLEVNTRFSKQNPSLNRSRTFPNENNRSRVFLFSYYDFYFTFLNVATKTIKAALVYKLQFVKSRILLKAAFFPTEKNKSHGFYSRKYGIGELGKLIHPYPTAVELIASLLFPLSITPYSILSISKSL